MEMVQGLMRTGVIFAVGAILSACGPRHYTPQEDEEIYGTWVSVRSSPEKVVMLPDGTWEEYIYQSDTSPWIKGFTELIEKWKDSAGNTWYKASATSTYGLGKGMRSQELDRIDKSGRVWEFVFTWVGKYDPKNFPTKIDSKDTGYRIYERAVR